MPNKVPPGWINRWLERLLKDRFHDEVIGDLEEWFELQISEGSKYLFLKYFIAAIREIKRYQLRSTGQIIIQLSDMTLINNNIKIGLRSLVHRKFTTILNIIGLTTAFACLMFILVFVGHELSVDRYHANSDQTFKMLRVLKNEKGRKNSNTQTALGNLLTSEFGHKLEVARYGNDPVLVTIDDKSFYEGDFYWGSASMFSVFDFPMVYGNSSLVLKEPNTVVLTESVSNKYFGEGVNPVGQVLPIKIYDGDVEMSLRIDGVMEDLPSNTNFPFELLGSIENAFELYGQFEHSWGFNWLRTFVHIPEVDDVEIIKSQFPLVLEEHLPEGVSDILAYDFQPLNDVHLYSGGVSGYYAGNIDYVVTFCLVALFIVIIAVINKINLTTAGVSTRSLEVGIRKANGATSGEVFRQYFTEYMLLFALCFLLSMILVFLLWNPFTSFIQLEVGYSFLWDFNIIWMFIFCIVICALVGSSYPAMVLSGIGSVAALTSGFSHRRGNRFRKALVVVQFSVSVFLIICTAVIFDQIQFMMNQDLGFGSKDLIRIKAEDKQVQNRLEVLKSEIQALPSVSSVAISSESLPSQMNNGWDFHWDAVSKEQHLGVNAVAIDADYLSTIGAQLIAGENLSRSYSVDSARSVLINESAAKMMGVEDPIGMTVHLGWKSRKIVGVVKDFHYRSLKEAIGPVAYFIGTSGYRSSPDNVFLRVDPQNTTQALSDIERIWDEYSTSEPIYVQFVEQAYDDKYGPEERYFQLFIIFASLSISISCIGLLGMAIFIINSRAKEISIRKVLGSSVGEIVRFIGLEFTLLVVTGFLIAIPFSVYSIRNWLDQFPYRVDISIGLILIAGIVSLLIAWLTIGFNTIKVALSNPIRYLRQE